MMKGALAFSIPSPKRSIKHGVPFYGRAPVIGFFGAFVLLGTEAAGPPIVSAIITGFSVTLDIRPWRAGGLAGLPRPATSITSKHLYLRPTVSPPPLLGCLSSSLSK